MAEKIKEVQEKRNNKAKEQKPDDKDNQKKLEEIELKNESKEEAEVI